MEFTISTRRIRRILDHLSGSEAISPPSSNLLAMNCSSTLNSMARRYDNRMLFTHQESASQDGFMQQVSVKESHGSSDSALQSLASKCSCASSGNSSYQNQEEPLFSRKAREKFSLPNLRDVHSSMQDPVSSSFEALKFAGASSGKNQEQPVYYSRIAHPAVSDVDTGLVWSPRIDVAESSCNYFVIVELPGVNINGIRVEVDDHNLIITGKRIIQQQWRVMNSFVDSNITYHRKEILQGPYEVDWPLPKDVNKDRISAEFVDGFLRIMVPKIIPG